MPRDEKFCYKTGFLHEPISVPVKAASYCEKPECGTPQYSMCRFPATTTVVFSELKCPIEQRAVMKSLEPI